MRYARSRCLLCLFVPFLHAQTSTSGTGWYQYFGDHPVSEHWGVHAEGQWRRDNAITRWEQLLLRTGTNFKVNKQLTLTLGYTYLRTFEYGEIPREPTREHRIYQEVNLTQTVGRVELENRFRLEQRFMADEQDYAWAYGDRVRYRLQGRIPLQARPVDDSRLYLSLYNEVFVNFGAHGGPQALDQNRTYGALGVNLKGKSKIEVGYQYRYYPQANGVLQLEHSLMVSLFSQKRLGRSR